MTAPEALRLTGVAKCFGPARVVDGVDLSLAQGERLALIGPNGAGKTTLFNLITGRLTPTAGRIELFGRDITGLPPWRSARRGLGRGFQMSGNFPALTVWDNLRVATLRAAGGGHCFWRRLDAAPAVAGRAARALGQVGLVARRDQLASTLTYAEQRALDLGMVLAGDPAVLLLDEPTAGMSRAEADALVALILRVSAGKSLLVIEHDLKVVFGLAGRIAVLDQGRLLATGAPDQVRADPRVRAAYLGASGQAGVGDGGGGGEVGEVGDGAATSAPDLPHGGSTHSQPAAGDAAC